MRDYQLQMRLESIKLEKQRLKESRERQVPVIRVPAQVKIFSEFASDAEIVPGRVVLNDFRPDHLKFFLPVNLTPGQVVSLAIEEPVACYVRGTVFWSYPVSRDLRVFSEVPCNYRVRINFDFDSPEEKQTIERFCRYLFSQILRPKPPRSWKFGIPDKRK